jgi:hypothetical protein
MVCVKDTKSKNDVLLNEPLQEHPDDLDDEVSKNVEQSYAKRFADGIDLSSEEVKRLQEKARASGAK